MKKKEIKKLTKEQALKEFEKLKKDLFNIRFQKINGQIKNPSKIKDKILDKWISDRIIIWKDYNANMSKYYENLEIIQKMMVRLVVFVTPG